MYLDFFNLKEYPFNQCHDLDYYFDCKYHKEMLEVLLVGMEINDGIIKITGQSGTGKSLLCQLFLEKISNHYNVIYLANPYCSHQELLEQIARELDLPEQEIKDNAQLMDLIDDKVQELTKKKKRIVLLFDEAQGLSQESLEFIRILSNLERNKSKLYQIILVGGLELDENLNNLTHFMQRISFTYKLLPIQKEDVEQYIMHRLAQALKPNQQHGITLTPQAIKLLYKKTNGIPRLINLICHKALMIVFSNQERVITKNVISYVIQDTESIQSRFRWQQLFISWRINK